MLGVAGYQGFEFTESAEFCGTICHNMDPQYHRYEQSPHRPRHLRRLPYRPRPRCVRQGQSRGHATAGLTVMNLRSPVPPAITELRPATRNLRAMPLALASSSALCSSKTVHFAPDEANTRHDYKLLVKVGGSITASARPKASTCTCSTGSSMWPDDALEPHPLGALPIPRWQEWSFRSDGKPATDPAPGENPAAGLHRLPQRRRPPVPVSRTSPSITPWRSAGSIPHSPTSSARLFGFCPETTKPNPRHWPPSERAGRFLPSQLPRQARCTWPSSRQGRHATSITLNSIPNSKSTGGPTP